MSKNLNLIIIVIMTLVFIFVPIIMKKVVWKKLLSQLDNEQYDEFYETEILLRKQLKYPPFCDIIMFAINSSDKEEVRKSI